MKVAWWETRSGAVSCLLCLQYICICSLLLTPAAPDASEYQDAGCSF